MRSHVWMQVTKLADEIDACAAQAVKGTGAEGLNTRLLHTLDALYSQEQDEDQSRKPRAGMKPSHIARQIGVAATSFTPSLDMLENKGLIERKMDGEDRRAVRIHLTRAGRALGETVQNAVGKINKTFAQKLAS